VGVSPTKFDEWIAAGRLPKPSKLDGIVLWDRVALDASLDAIFYPPADADLSKWDDVRV
jgi:predicted DNA-binding transcriptional regulator AlpA